jgi:hypothetical protein
VSPGRGGGDATQTVSCPAGRFLSDGLSRLGGRRGVRRLHQPSGLRADFCKGPENAGYRGDCGLRGAFHGSGLRFHLLSRPNQWRQGRLHLLKSDFRRSLCNFRTTVRVSTRCGSSTAIAIGCDARSNTECSASAGGATGTGYRFPAATHTSSARSSSSSHGCPGVSTRNCDGPSAEPGFAAAGNALPAHCSSGRSGSLSTRGSACFKRS